MWQPEFWEHTIRDKDDYERHFHYLHYNPVKHGLATSPADYPYSTFHRHVGSKVYEPTWGSDGVVAFSLEGLNVEGIEFGE